jgi:electron transport complex protein RnfD
MVDDRKSLITVSLSPHIHTKESVPNIMRSVIYALLPAAVMALMMFGINAFRVMIVAVASAVFCEYILQKWIMKTRVTVDDYSAAVTGLLLAFNVPSNLPTGMVIAGSVFAVAVGKMTFGGLGNNPFNPALVGRVFLLISFPVAMTTWPKPLTNLWSFDTVTTATPLGILKEGVKQGSHLKCLFPKLPTYSDLFVGTIPGSMGEISALMLIIGGIYLLLKRIITWHIPASMIGTIMAFTGILWLIDPSKYADPLFHVLSGGVMLGAIFMATDMVTSPMTPAGQLIFGASIGLLTVIIRIWGGYPEGVSFAILIMNALVPVIDKYFTPKKYGVIKR